MRIIKYIFVNETHSPNPTSADLGNIVPDFRHSHVVSGAGISREELIQLLASARKQWPAAKILGLSEINGRNFQASEFMNSIRRELSDYPRDPKT